jgi:pimeloyl-ACP methyl ester carboxylesterase
LKNNKIAGKLGKFLIRFNLWRGITNFLGGYQGIWDIFKQETFLVSKQNFDQKVFFGILFDLLKINPRQLLEKNQSQTLFVCGEKDRITRKKEIIKFCQTRKNAHYALIPKANHALVSKNTKEFNKIVTKFLLSQL